MMVYKYKEATKDCKVAIESDRKYISAYKRITMCYFQLNQTFYAKETLKDGVLVCPENIELQEHVNNNN